MGKVIYTEKKDTGNINHIAGTITFVSEGVGEYKDKVVNVGINLDVYNKDTKKSEKKYLSVAFWNSDDPSKPQMADRVRKAKLGTGSFVYIRTGNITEASQAAGDGTPRLNAKGYDFQYTVKREIARPDMSPVNIICGTARRVRENGDFFSISIPVNTGSGDNKETTWYGISFADSERSKIGTRAAKVIKGGIPVCVLTGSIKDSEGNNGGVYHDAYAWDFVVGFAKEDSK